MLGRITCIAALVGLTACAPAPPLEAPSTPAAPPEAPAAPVVDAPEGPILLAVRGTAMSSADKKRRPLEIDDELRSGDFFAYHVRIDRDAFVYVLQFFADGTAQVLFPERGKERVLAGRETRLPLDPQGWFQLDEATGTEHLYVIASQEPLEASDPGLAELIGNVRTSPQLGDVPRAEAADGDAPPEAAAAATPSAEPPAATSAESPKPKAHAKAKGAPRGVALTGRPGPLKRHIPRFRDRAVKLVRIEEDGVVEYQGRAPQEGVGIVHFPFEHR